MSTGDKPVYSGPSGDKFSAHQIQDEVQRVRGEMLGKLYRHWKGGSYRVMWLDVDEMTGEIRVSYQSVQNGWVWSRTLEVFNEKLPSGQRRFTRLDAGPLP